MKKELRHGSIVLLAFAVLAAGASPTVADVGSGAFPLVEAAPASSSIVALTGACLLALAWRQLRK